MSISLGEPSAFGASFQPAAVGGVIHSNALKLKGMSVIARAQMGDTKGAMKAAKNLAVGEMQRVANAKDKKAAVMDIFSSMGLTKPKPSPISRH